MGEAFTDIYCKECVTGQSIALCGGMQETGPLPEAFWGIYKSYSRQIRWFNKIEISCFLPNNRDTGTEETSSLP